MGGSPAKRINPSNWKSRFARIKRPAAGVSIGLWPILKLLNLLGDWDTAQKYFPSVASHLRGLNSMSPTALVLLTLVSGFLWLGILISWPDVIHWWSSSEIRHPGLFDQFGNELARDIEHPESGYRALYILAGGFLVIVTVVIFIWSGIQQRAESIATTEATSTPRPTANYVATSVKDLFDLEFLYANLPNERTYAQASDGHQVTVRYRLFFNFDENSEFVSAYFPIMPDDSLITEVAKRFAQDINAIVSEATKTYVAAIRRPDETTKTSEKDLRFSGRVYLYFENTLDEGESFDIDRYYRTLGYVPKIHDTHSLAIHASEKHFPPPEWKPGSFQVPGAGVLPDKTEMSVIVKGPEFKGEVEP